MTNKEIRVEFNKRFASGEQYIELDTSKEEWEIIPIPKTYFWEERAVYNHIGPAIELIMAFALPITTIFTKDGLVEQLIPLQRDYNTIKNTKMMYINRLQHPVIIVEDGSIDVDALDAEGLAPGKVIIYRQGSNIPRIKECDMDMLNFLSQEEDRILRAMHEIIDAYKSISRPIN